MQMQIPIFPKETKLINASLGFYEKEDMVYYLHHGSPVFCHNVGDRNSYRYILGYLVNARLCRISEISQTLGINRKNVERYARALDDNGIDWFFNREDNRGKCHQMTDTRMREAQKPIDEGLSNKVIGARIGVIMPTVMYRCITAMPQPWAKSM
jgi:biotin operon repressor